MSVIHVCTPPWVCVYGRTACRLMFRCASGEVVAASVLYCDPYDYLPGEQKMPNLRETPMTLTTSTASEDFFTCEGIPLPTHKLRYHFALTFANGERKLLASNGLLDVADLLRLEPFHIAYRFEGQTLRPPAWAGQSVWYQIFPDRFDALAPLPSAVEFIPQREGFWGGTLTGITHRLPYLADLGVTGLYLNPIFQSPSNHRYDTLDYATVDPRLGTEADLIALSDALHARKMRLMLDGVFNHASDRCPQFRHALAHGKASPYWDWFLFRDEQAARGTPAEALTDERMKTNPPYECFAFAANMPKWNTDHPAVIDHLVTIAERWTQKLHLDAWRLDVPDEISPRFLRTFRERMQTANPEVEIIGEIWGEPWPWLTGDQFDGTMHYPAYFAIRDFLLRKTLSAPAFCDRMNTLAAQLPPAQYPSQMYFIGNHDLPRPLYEAGGSTDAVKAALLLLLLLPGEVSLYYGDEIALTGGSDPANRGAMRWQQSAQAEDMLRFAKEAIAFRKKILSQGFHQVHFEAISPTEACVKLCFGRRTLTLTLNPAVLRPCTDALTKLDRDGFFRF